MLHAVFRLPTLYSSSLRERDPAPIQAFAFLSQAPWTGIKPELPGLSVGLTSPLTKDCYLGLNS